MSDILTIVLVIVGAAFLWSTAFAIGCMMQHCEPKNKKKKDKKK